MRVRILLGMAETLAIELNVNETRSESQMSTDRGNRLQRRYWERRARIRVLLYIRKAQSSLRFGANMPEASTIEDDISLVKELSQRTVSPELEWLSGLAAWGELCILSNEARNLLFGRSSQPSSAGYDEHIVSLKYFTSRLDIWSQETARLHRKFLQNLELTILILLALSPNHDILSIEYYYLRTRLGSLCVNTISKRLLPRINSLSALSEYLAVANSIYDSHTFESRSSLHETLQASRSLLSLIVHLADRKRLHYAPLRVFTRAIFAATMIVKVIYAPSLFSNSIITDN